MTDRQIQQIALTNIRPGENDRKEFDKQSVVELAASIRDEGLMQPITVRNKPDADTKTAYEIVAGERRFRAHLVLMEKVESGEWDATGNFTAGHIAAEVRDLTDEQAERLMFIENMQREELNMIDEAKAYQKRLDGGTNVAELARITGKSPNYVISRLDLLKLSPKAQDVVRMGGLSLQYALLMINLKHHTQDNIITWMDKQTYPVRLPYFNKFLAGQRQAEIEQGTTALFDMSQIFSATAIEAAENPDKRVSDFLPKLDHLPALPLTQGNPGNILDAYIAKLIEAGHEMEAAVLLDTWHKMMKCNKIQIDPWDSKVLPAMEVHGQPNGNVFAWGVRLEDESQCPKLDILK